MPQADHFEVIGDDYDEYGEPDVEGIGYAGPMGDFEGDGEVIGSVMGGEVIGYDEYGQPVVGAKRRRRRRPRGGVVRVHKPGWRSTQLAPGVQVPQQGLLPLPLAGVPTSIFTATQNNITFEGQIQKPFRGERLLVSTVRTGTTATGRLISQLFVGTDLNQLDVPGFDAEQVGDPNAFGVRLAMKAAQPGVFIRLVVNLSNALTGADTIFCSVSILGRAIH